MSNSGCLHRGALVPLEEGHLAAVPGDDPPRVVILWRILV